MSSVTLGGERLGSGNRNKVYLRDYERSTHDLGYIWRSTMASGTLVPFASIVATPGDTFDINLNVDVMTHPTIGPLFGSYKVQLDMFQIPVRLYQGQLHMNKLNVGLDMSKVKLPTLQLMADNVTFGKPFEGQQINPSCIFSYLNIRGLGHNVDGNTQVVRNFNGTSFLAYWDIYKQYYSNKQEEIGAVIHNNLVVLNTDDYDLFIDTVGNAQVGIPSTASGTFTKVIMRTDSVLKIICGTITSFDEIDLGRILIQYKPYATKEPRYVSVDQLFQEWTYDRATLQIRGTAVNPQYITWAEPVYGYFDWFIDNFTVSEQPTAVGDIEPRIKTFPLTNIDLMREKILMDVQNSGAFDIIAEDIEPYNLPSKNIIVGSETLYSKMSNQEGLALKTYQSDLFNNWVSTEWIDGDEGINEITKIDTSDGNFTINELILNRKIYDMMNRIAVSGGTYDDWLDSVYTHDRNRGMENPMYMGGLIKELVFQEVVSNSESADGTQPLGTLAGKGRLGEKHKGGFVKIKTDEPCYIMGIVSLTPRIDYSQGNGWDANLESMNDFHKPALDEIGFQDLITDQMAWWDTGIANDRTVTFKSAGKQPAWINYMTDYNKVYGNFAIESDQAFMVLLRRYEAEAVGMPDTQTVPRIKDLTTYIDPVKYNHIFAYTRRDAQNFWVQIKVDITARRKMSAKVMPNL